MRQWLTITAGGLCLTLASSVQALGVGEPQQVSPLNRPLHVLLPLTDGAGLEPAQITVSVADEAAYRESGLARSALIDALSTQVVRENGSLMLVIDSPRRVREPFLDLLLVVTWPAGQWQREVSLLFDPADYASSQPLVGGDRSIAVSSPMSVSAAPQAMSMAPVERADVVPRRAQSWPTQLSVHPGDSLSSLASSLLPRSGMSRQALMVALFKANPAAFVGGDINRLRSGGSLDVPSAETVAAMPRSDAAATFQALARATDDGRPLIDIVGHDASPGDTRVGASNESAQLAALERRLSELAAESERQRAAIVALQAERDGLQGALAAAGKPSPADSGGGGNRADDAAAVPVSESAQAASGSVAASASNAALATDTQPSPPKSPPVLTTEAAASSAMPSGISPTPSLWQRLGSHLDWIGGGLLIVLLGIWAWQRRRAKAGSGIDADDMASRVVETPADKTPATSKSPVAPARRGAATALDVDSASISQADIYMAYGRHAEARDWLRQQLAEEENAHFRLGLLRALGELRDLDGLEEALAGFGADATDEQRREGQVLVDDYRARHVEESWDEATAEVDQQDPGTAWKGDEDDIDALFESQVTSPPARAASPMVARRETGGSEPGRSVAPMSALFDDELASDGSTSSASDESEGSLHFSSIDYVAPTLDFEAKPATESSSSPLPPAAVATPVDVPRGASSTPKDVIDFSSLSFLDSVSESVPDPADEPALGDSQRYPGAWATSLSSEGEGPVTRGDERENPGERVSGVQAGDSTGSHREIPAGWDVEEVEFQPQHRDNGRP